MAIFHFSCVSDARTEGRKRVEASILLVGSLTIANDSRAFPSVSDLPVSVNQPVDGPCVGVASPDITPHKSSHSDFKQRRVKQEDMHGGWGTQKQDKKGKDRLEDDTTRH